MKNSFATYYWLFLLPLLTLVSGEIKAIEKTTSNQNKSKITSAAKIAQPPKLTGRIIGGKEVTNNTYPFMVAMIKADEEVINSFSCGASLISPTLVLTAAHCLSGFPSVDELEIFIGGTSLANEGQGRRIKLKNILVDKMFFEKAMAFDFDTAVIEGHGDIAILELAESVDNISPIKIITADMFEGLTAEVVTGELINLTVMGWGNRDSSGDVDNSDYPKKLHEVVVPLYDNDQCLNDYKAKYGESHEFQGLSFCAGFSEGKKDACQGDSGGPIVYSKHNEWYQVGVVSGGYGCAQQNAPGIYASIHQYQSIDQLYKSLMPLEALTELEIRRTTIERFPENQQLSLTYQITNLKERDLLIESVTVQTDATQISNDTCFAQTLIAKQSCSFTITANFEGKEQKEVKATVASKHPGVVNSVIRSIGGTQFLLMNQQQGSPLSANYENSIKLFNSNSGEWALESNNGEVSITSAKINDNELSALMATFSSERLHTLFFEYKISSQENYDEFNLVHNGKRLTHDSGESTEFVSYQVTDFSAAENELVFSYSKDSTLSEGNDNVVIKNLSLLFNNRSPLLKLKDDNLTVNELSPVTLDASATIDADSDKLTYLWEHISGPELTVIDNSGAIATFIAPSTDKDETITMKVTVVDDFTNKGLSIAGGEVEQSPTNNSSLITVQVKHVENSIKANATNEESSGGSANIFIIMLLLTAVGVRQSKTKI